MAQVDTPRAEVVGSLLRPAGLREARARRAEGALSAAEFKQIEDGIVDEAIDMQEALALDVITDGEMRRSHFLDTLEAFEGLSDQSGETFAWQTPGSESPLQYQAPRVVTDRLRLARSVVTEEFAYARARARRPLKVTLPSPLQMYFFWADASKAAYKDPFEMFADAAAIIRAEAEALVGLGCRYIQIDAPEFAFFVDDEVSQRFAELGMPASRTLSEGVEIVNGIPTGDSGVTFAMHVCRGNFGGRWIAAGGYGAIARDLFRGASNFDAFMLEYDDDRSGGFEPMREVPDDKRVVLGLISSKREQLESRESIVRRIEEAAQHISKEQLALSSQCGFGTDSEDEQISEGAQRRKLALVAEIAAEVWG